MRSALVLEEFGTAARVQHLQRQHAQRPGQEHQHQQPDNARRASGTSQGVAATHCEHQPGTLRDPAREAQISAATVSMR
jgi:hypothetical protein